MNPKYIDQGSRASVPPGMMATRKMKLSVYRQLMHDPLMEDPVQPFSFDAASKKVLRALLIKDGIRSVMHVVVKLCCTKRRQTVIELIALSRYF